MLTEIKPENCVNVAGRFANKVDMLIFLSALDCTKYSTSAELTDVAAVKSVTLLSAIYYTDGEGVTLGVGVTDGVLLGVTDGVAVIDGVTDGVAVIDGVTDGVAVTLGVGVTDGVLLGVTLGVGDGDSGKYVSSAASLLMSANATSVS